MTVAPINVAEPGSVIVRPGSTATAVPPDTYITLLPAPDTVGAELLTLLTWTIVPPPADVMIKLDRLYGPEMARFSICPLSPRNFRSPAE
jgi:hypothetical protein